MVVADRCWRWLSTNKKQWPEPSQDFMLEEGQEVIEPSFHVKGISLGRACQDTMAYPAATPVLRGRIVDGCDTAIACGSCTNDNPRTSLYGTATGDER